MKIYINKSANYFKPILYTLKIIEKNQQIEFDFVDLAENPDLIWDHLNSISQPISQPFYSELENSDPKFSHTKIFVKEQVIRDASGNKDLIATIFYMINCLQEFNPEKTDLDNFERFKFESSYQYRFNSIETNLVQEYIDLFVNLIGLKGKEFKSSFFISHDIDTIYGSFIQDGFWALKNRRIDIILKLIANELIRNPHWRNIDKIIKIDSEYDIRSTFFWLVNKGRGNLNIKNADYSIEKEHKLLDLVENAGCFNGLHKSCSDISINDELEKLNFISSYNRFHFMRYLPYKDWEEISKSKLTFDASMGFAERYGFRNSYGNAFQPYNIVEKKPFDFVEAPLTFMDGTFHKYMKFNPDQIGDTIIEFYEQNKSNCLFSLLWHNTYFTNYKYKSFLKEYKKILSYIYENRTNCLTPPEIVEINKLSW